MKPWRAVRKALASARLYSEPRRCWESSPAGTATVDDMSWYWRRLVAMAAYQPRTHPAARRWVASSCWRTAPALSSLGLGQKVAVITNEAPLALCCSWWRPRIWLSTGAVALLPPAELAAVLRHEQAHLQRRHPLQLLIARSLAAALPFLPVLRESGRALPRAQELAADRAVIRAGERHALGRALLTMVGARGNAPALPLAPGMVGALDARLDQLTGVVITPALLSRRSLVHTWLMFALGLLLLKLIAFGFPVRQSLMGFFGTSPWHGAFPWRCLVAPTILCGCLHELLTALARRRCS